jgi:hypothetical protein
MDAVLRLIVVVALLCSLWGDLWTDYPAVDFARPAWIAPPPPRLDDPHHTEIDTRNPPRDQVGQQPGTGDVPFFGSYDGARDPALWRRPSFVHLMSTGTNPLLPR